MDRIKFAFTSLVLLLVLCDSFAQPGGEKSAMDITKTTHIYKTVNGCEIGLDIYRKGGGAAQPVILWIHGGGLIFGSRAMRQRQLELYLDAGFTVVSIDYRLAPETKLDGIVADALDAYRWVREEGTEHARIDPSRMAIIGHSAGGYLTLTLGALAQPRPAALVAFYGYGDIAGDWYTQPDPFYNQVEKVTAEEAWQSVGKTEISEGSFETRFPFYLYCRQNGLWTKEVGGRDPQVDAAWFKRYCPVKNVSANYPPTLLLHGDADTDVPYEQSVMMAQELSAHGVEHELITIQNGAHGFDSQNGGLDNAEIRQTFDTVTGFLKKHCME